jgi:hypothetical protein
MSCGWRSNKKNEASLSTINVTAQWVSIAVRTPVIRLALVFTLWVRYIKRYILLQLLDNCTLHINNHWVSI